VLYIRVAMKALEFESRIQRPSSSMSYDIETCTVS